MNETILLAIAALLFGAAIIYVLFIRKDHFDEYAERRAVGLVSIPPEEKAELRRIRDIAEINAGRCPDCGSQGSLCEGPSGGMSQNVACDKCHMEFNVHQGFGTGAFKVDRTGKLPEQRARRTFGFGDDDFPPKK